MSPEDAASLAGVLRCELTAVHQQFVHVLALRAWGDKETAARIMEVDRVDFPVAMRIIDHLVASRAPLKLASESFEPGAGRCAILLAEQGLENRLRPTLQAASCHDDRATAIVRDALAPREAYADWLSAHLDGALPRQAQREPPFPETSRTFAHLVATIERSMIHAFVHWHAGDRHGADMAWATSGAAMMHATRFVNLFAAHGTTPVPQGMPDLDIAADANEALDRDRRAAGRCAREAAKASASCDEPELAGLCRTIADHCDAMSSWGPDRPHPAAATNPPVFASFEATLKKFVRF